MRVLHVAFSDGLYGADRAAYRIHRSLLAIGIDSEMLVQKGVTGDPTVHVMETIWPHGERWRQRVNRGVNRLLANSPDWLVGQDRRTQASLALFPSRWTRWIQAAEYQVVHLHWINGEMLALEQIADIVPPVFWSCHDQWPFRGLRHYDPMPVHGVESFPLASDTTAQQGILNDWMLVRKRRLFKRKPMVLVGPSQWMAQRASTSGIPNRVIMVRLPLDARRWPTHDQRRVQGGVPVIAFGAVGGGRDPRKGFDLFVSSLHHLKRHGIKVQVILFGDASAAYDIDLPMPTTKLGRLNDSELRAVFASSDLVCLCSRIDNSPLIALEAMACGTPVIAFSVGGLPELIEDGVTGYLVEPGNPRAFADALIHAFNQDLAAMGQRARTYVEREHAPEYTANQLLMHYQQAVAPASVGETTG